MMPDAKYDALLALARILHGIPYCLIGGVAMQFYTNRQATRDIDIAVLSYDHLPRAALEAAGFRHTGSFTYTQNWKAPDGTPVQFTEDPYFEGAISRAETIPWDEVMRVLSLHERRGGEEKHP